MLPTYYDALYIRFLPCGYDYTSYPFVTSKNIKYHNVIFIETFWLKLYGTVRVAVLPSDLKSAPSRRDVLLDLHPLAISIAVTLS